MYVPLCTVVVVSTSTIMCTVYMLICNWPFKGDINYFDWYKITSFTEYELFQPIRT